MEKIGEEQEKQPVIVRKKRQQRGLGEALEGVGGKAAQGSASASWRQSFKLGKSLPYSSWSWKGWLSRARTRLGSSQGAAQD
jgi:hypothetical protein